jgi:hypothetical protein
LWRNIDRDVIWQIAFADFSNDFDLALFGVVAILIVSIRRLASSPSGRRKRRLFLFRPNRYRIAM